MRGGLDDALERLKRRDELRRRASSDGGGISTPPAVTELAEAVAAVVARHPDLAITMGVEGVGAPMLLRVAYEDGTVHVTADNPAEVTAAPGPGPVVDFDFDFGAETEAEADFEAEAAEVVEPVEPVPAAAWAEHNGHDGPTSRWERTVVLTPPEPTPAPDPSRFEQPRTVNPSFEKTRVLRPPRDAGGAHRSGAAPAPPADDGETVAFTSAGPFRPAPAASVQPPPLAEPIPYTVEPGQPEQTEQAAKRLAALLREDPSLLQD